MQARKTMHCGPWMDNINAWTGLPVDESVRMTEDRDEWRKCPWCGQPLDRGWLKNRTIEFRV